MNKYSWNFCNEKNARDILLHAQNILQWNQWKRTHAHTTKTKWLTNTMGREGDRLSMCCCAHKRRKPKHTITKSSLAFAISVARHLLKQDIINRMHTDTVSKHHLQATQNESKTFTHHFHTSMAVAVRGVLVLRTLVCVCAKYLKTETATKQNKKQNRNKNKNSTGNSNTKTYLQPKCNEWWRNQNDTRNEHGCKVKSSVSSEYEINLKATVITCKLN